MHSDKPPNVIHIFLESAEDTLTEKASFGDIMTPVTAFSEKGLRHGQLVQAIRTDWTIAGLIAANCGVPLVQPWLNPRNQFVTAAKYTGNPDDIQFMPKATCLSDMLKPLGYTSSYFMGVDLSFGGTREFLNAHSYMNMKGYKEIYVDGITASSNWGVDDEYVFDAAYEQIRRHHAKNEPYHVTIVTMGGHGPDGVVSDSCLSGAVPIGQSPLKAMRGIECTNLLAAGMINRLHKEGALENTIVILQSDHLMMRSTLTEELNKYNRLNFFIAFGPGIEVGKIERPSAMFDVYPTILEMRGFYVPGQKAGLGVSFLNGEQSLVAKHGLKKLDDSIKQDRDLRNYLWGMTSQAAFDKIRKPQSFDAIAAAGH